MQCTTSELMTSPITNAVYNIWINDFTYNKCSVLLCMWKIYNVKLDEYTTHPHNVTGNKYTWISVPGI